MKKTTIIILVCIAIVLGMLLGIIVGVLNDNESRQAQINEIIKANEIMENNQINNQVIKNDIIETNQSEIKVSPNAVIYFEKYYKECGHTIIQKEKIEEKEVNKNEEYFKTAYSDWQLKEFSPNEVKLYKELEGSCDKHYLITVQDDKIAVFNIDSEGNLVLKEKTDIPITYLPQEDVELLKEGITANGDSELAKKLEDFE